MLRDSITNRAHTLLGVRSDFFSLITTVAALIVVAIVTPGCSNYQVVRRDVDQAHAATVSKIAAQQSSIVNIKPHSLVTRSDTAWLGSKAIQREKIDSLPPQFDKVVLRFPGRHNVASVAEAIQKTTGVRVMVHPDVLVPLARLAPVSGGSFTEQPNQRSATAIGRQEQPMALPGMTAPPGGLLQPIPGQQQVVAPDPSGDYFMDVPLNYSGPLRDFLDLICTRLGVDWDYRDGRIEIRRFLTRTFTIIALPGKTDFSSSLGKSGDVAAGNSGSGSSGGGSAKMGSFTSAMKVSEDSTIDYWKSIEGTIRSMLSNMGKLATNQGSGTITVTDIRDAVERIGRLVEEENKTMTKQVAFEIKVLAVRSSDNIEQGIDWNLVYQRLQNLAPAWGLSISNPGSLLTTSAGSVGVQILKSPTADGGLNALSGSQAFVRALADVGKITRMTTQRAMTLNRQAAPVAVTDQTNYAAETTPGIVAVAGSTVPVGIKPGTVTTGFIMNLLPTVTDNNAMVLTLSMDISELLKITNFSVGSGETMQSIQLPEVSATQFIQRVAMRTGETLVLSGFERLTKQYTQRTLDPGADPGIGGSFVGGTNNDSLVVLITPVIVEGL